MDVVVKYILVIPFQTIRSLHFIIYIYIIDCVCQRYHKECSTRTCADDCYNCWKKVQLKLYVRPWSYIWLEFGLFFNNYIYIWFHIFTNWTYMWQMRNTEFCSDMTLRYELKWYFYDIWISQNISLINGSMYPYCSRGWPRVYFFCLTNWDRFY